MKAKKKMKQGQKMQNEGNQKVKEQTEEKQLEKSMQMIFKSFIRSLTMMVNLLNYFMTSLLSLILLKISTRKLANVRTLPIGAALQET